MSFLCTRERKEKYPFRWKTHKKRNEANWRWDHVQCSITIPFSFTTAEISFISCEISSFLLCHCIMQHKKSYVNVQHERRKRRRARGKKIKIFSMSEASQRKTFPSIDSKAKRWLIKNECDETFKTRFLIFSPMSFQILLLFFLMIQKLFLVYFAKGDRESSL